MSLARLVRWSGLAVLVSGILRITRGVLDFIFIPAGMALSTQATTDIWMVLALLTVVIFMILVPGLIGLYVHQSSKAGVLGLVAFPVALVGTMLGFATFWSGYLYAPELAQSAPSLLDNGSPRLMLLGFLIPFLLFYVGWLLFGLVSVLARVFPRWAGALLMLGVPLILLQGLVFLPLLGDVVFAAGLVWMGYALWSEKGETVAQAEPTL